MVNVKFIAMSNVHMLMKLQGLLDTQQILNSPSSTNMHLVENTDYVLKTFSKLCDPNSVHFEDNIFIFFRIFRFWM